MQLAPFSLGHRFYRGNLHGHSHLSDGARSPAEVVAAYKALGYDFTCLSDHVMEGLDIGAASVPDSRSLRDTRFTTILSAELHCPGKKYDKRGLWHLVANGLPLDFPAPTADETGPELVRRAQAAGAYVSIAHPEWYGLTMDEALAVSHADAVEIYNHSCLIECDRAFGIAVADYLLNEGKRLHFNATDDSHMRLDDFGGGWVMVAAERNDPDLLVAALKAGHNYSSTGAEIHDLALDGDILTVRCSPAVSVAVAGPGEVSAVAMGPNLTYAEIDLARIRARQGYFRVTVIGNGGTRAWSNPYWFDQLA